MITMLIIIIIKCLLSLLSVHIEYQAVALHCGRKCVDSASDEDAVYWCCTFSLSVSRAEVASSSSRILGSRMIALAIAMRCF